MTFHLLLSDQLYTWSAWHARQTYFQSATPPHKSVAAIPPFGCHSARLSDRTLQTLRKTRLQMCQRPWAWSKILSLHQSNRQTPADGLRAPGLCRAGKAIFGQSSTRPGYIERDLRYQSRTPTSPGAAVGEAGGERNGQYAYCFPRCASGRDLDRQYAHIALRWRQFLTCHPGGNS